jgi:hypothetical protein
MILPLSWPLNRIRTIATMSVNSSPSAWKEIEGHFVPRRFEPLFVVLSFFVSYIGFWATLELFHWRTGSRGAYNW